MHYEIRKPDVRLQDFIKYYWILDFRTPGFIQKVIPSGETQLLFHYKEPFQELVGPGELTGRKQAASVFCGQVTGQKDILASGAAGCIGVVFYPHSPRVFFRVDMQELTDISVAAPFLSDDLEIVENKIIEIQDMDRRIEQIDNFFLKKLADSDLRHYDLIKHSIFKINASRGLVSVGDLLAEIGLTQRHYERIFSSIVGLSCKGYIEIAKFTHALSLMESDLSLTAIAYETGYYDQSHFIRSFKRYMGTSPRNFRSGKFA